MVNTVPCRVKVFITPLWPKIPEKMVNYLIAEIQLLNYGDIIAVLPKKSS